MGGGRRSGCCAGCRGTGPSLLQAALGSGQPRPLGRHGAAWDRLGTGQDGQVRSGSEAGVDHRRRMAEELLDVLVEGVGG